MSASPMRGLGAWSWAALAIALAGPPLLVLASRGIVGDAPRLWVQILLQTLYCVMAAFVVWGVVRREHLPLESIGLRRPVASTLIWAIALFAVIQWMLPILERPLVRMLGSHGLAAGVRQLRAIPLWFRLVLAVTGGIVEEIFYRGYAIERLAKVVGRRWIAAAISATVFGLAHIPFWGVGFSLAADLPFGIVMTVSYLWRRDLAANMLAHGGALVVAMFTV